MTCLHTWCLGKRYELRIHQSLTNILLVEFYENNQTYLRYETVKNTAVQTN